MSGRIRRGGCRFSFSAVPHSDRFARGEHVRKAIRGLVGKLWLIAGIVVTCLAGTSTGTDNLAFELPRIQGDQFRLESGVYRLTVICFLGTECPMAKAYASKLSDLQVQYAEQGIKIVGVMSNRQDSRTDVERYVQQMDVQFDIVLDAKNQVADRYGALRTPEVFLLDQKLRLRYHGRIDDQYAPGVARADARREDLKVAIDELLAGKPVAIKETQFLGCVIGRVKSEEARPTTRSSITFEQDVRPVLETHCVECHRAGEIGPFSMESYDEVVGWAETMLEAVDQQRMPPWHANAEYGRFWNERFMPESDRDVLRAWVEAGTPEGRSEADGQSSVADLIAGDSELSPEENADQILPMRERPFVVPRDGIVEYQYFVVDPRYDEDKWINAAFVLPGSRDVVHHALVFVRPPDGSDFQGLGVLAGYVPGQKNIALPEGFAIKVPAGSKFVFQMHYTPNGTESSDLSKLAVRFVDREKVTHGVYTILGINQEFEIPPGVSSYEVEGIQDRIPDKALLMAISPHMHYRGKSFRVSARYADQRQTVGASGPGREVLLDVPSYDFNWQHTYRLTTPLPLDDFDALGFTAVFDNSGDNPFNPNPAEWVMWGDQTWEEMAVAFFDIAVPLESGDSKALEPVAQSQGADEAADHVVTRSAKAIAYVEKVFSEMDQDSDGVIRKAEGSIVVRRFHFRVFDRNGDGVATREEIEELADILYPL